MLKEEKVSPPEIAQLEIQARQAYEQRRTRECVGFIKSLLRLDPENSEGRRLQTAIQKEIQRDLTDAHALIEDSRNRNDGAKYRKAAEIILLKVLYLDPDNDAAKALRANARTLDEQQEAVTSSASPMFAETLERPDEVPFTTGAAAVVETHTKVRQSNRFTVPIILAILAVGGASAFFLLESGATSANETPAPSASSPAFQPFPASPVSSEPVPSAVSTTSTVVTEPVFPALPPPAADTPRPADPGSVATPAPPPAATQTARFDSARPVAFVEAGTLSVTSPVTADVFMNGKPVGITPLSLQLIAGRHTLEYRLGDLRTVVTHEIKANQTTNSVVTFDLTVQINARPWAQVYVDGTPRRPLGQTPLSNVSVPIGSVLIFENPNFATKSHRVAAGDAAIQMIFP
jgi:hypothetical protein